MEIILFLTMMVMITYVFSGYLYRVALVQSSRVDLKICVLKLSAQI
ncbi:potassium-transporting ATPase subunit A [Staphylococcus aureus]|nr:potassium-transporting ATPase subunit A [Staphylococcus aureus]CAC8316947.1 potassium-transporting ATPase subunit A [Staphylococcus aureus]